MSTFPLAEQIAGLLLEPQTIDGEPFLLVTVLLNETDWLRTTSYDVQASLRRWDTRAAQVGMKDEQGVCRCWLEMGFTRSVARYGTWRLRRKVQRWTVQVSLEEYWGSLYAAFGGQGFPMTPPPSTGAQLGGAALVVSPTVLGGVALFGGSGGAAAGAGAGAGAAAAAGAGALVTIAGVAVYWLASSLGTFTGLLPSGRELVSEGWELQDALEPGGQQALHPAIEQLLLILVHALAVEADGSWRSTIPISNSLQCRLADVDEGSERLYCRVTETWPCGERWLPTGSPRGAVNEWVGWSKGGVRPDTPPDRLERIPALYLPHTASALAQLLADPCCKDGAEAPPVEAPHAETPETQPTETRPTETRPTETQPTETQPTETQPTETQPTEPTPPADPDSVDRLVPELAWRLRRGHIERLSQLLELTDAQLLFAWGLQDNLLRPRDQVELLLRFPKATAFDVIFLVNAARMSARRMADPREAREIAERLMMAPARTWLRKLDELGLPLTYDAPALGRALLEWLG